MKNSNFKIWGIYGDGNINVTLFTVIWYLEFDV
jgi:hypothetical protein